MEGIVTAGGYGEKSDWVRLATPRASETLRVYGLSVDVFYFPPQNVADPPICLAEKLAENNPPIIVADIHGGYTH